MRKNITTIIFDFGGVLAYSDIEFASQKFHEDYGIDKQELKKQMLFWADNSSDKEDDSEYFKKIGKLFKLKKDELTKVFLRVEPTGALEIVKELKKKDYGLFLLSNQLTFKTNYLKNNYDFSAFDALFFSNELKLRKPNKDIFEFVLKKINKTPKECVFIDDTLENLKSANSLGLKTIHFRDVPQLRTDLRILGVDV